MSSIGLAAGGGMYPVSGGATVIGLVALNVVRRFEGKDGGAVRRRVAVTTVGGADALPGLVAAIRAAGCAVSDSEYESVREEGRLTVAFDVDAPSHVSHDGAAPRGREPARRGARPDRPARLIAGAAHSQRTPGAPLDAPRGAVDHRRRLAPSPPRPCRIADGFVERGIVRRPVRPSPADSRSGRG